MMLDYQIAVLGILLCMALIAAINVATFRRVKSHQKPHHVRMVSVLVPARNEEENIAVCLSGLVAQDYPKYEIVVLDDNSDDATAMIVKDWQQMNSQVRYLKGAPLPDGWVGKCFACHQLSKEAKGELLLFIDADTIHTRQSISAAVASMEKYDAHLLTAIPFLTLKSFWEKAVMPMLHFTTFCFLPFPLVSASKNPKFAMANGQFMLFDRKVYEAIGGHAAVKDALVEDVWLSRLVKSKGFSLRVMDGVPIVSTRMYTSFRQIWEGFSKNLFPGFKYSVPAILAVVVLNAVTSILPYGFLLFAVVSRSTHAWTSIVAMQVAVILGVHLMMALRFKMNLIAALAHPLAMSIVVGIAMNSTRWSLMSGGLRWKGRTYDFRGQSAAS